MKEEILTFKIIDRQKKNNTSKLRQIIFVAAICIGLVAFYLPDIQILSLDPFIIKSLMIMIAWISVPLGFMFYFKIPSKGEISFHSKSIQTTIGKTKIEIPITAQTSIIFYNVQGIENGTTYLIEIKEKEKSIVYELDIVFSKEKEELEKVKHNWRLQGIEFEEKTTSPITHS